MRQKIWCDRWIVKFGERNFRTEHSQIGLCLWQDTNFAARAIYRPGVMIRILSPRTFTASFIVQFGPTTYSTKLFWSDSFQFDKMQDVAHQQTVD